MVKWILFSILAVAILVISFRSLLKPNSHGFWRFFAWELILVLIAHNLDHWFADPFSWHQIISWILLLTCLVPLILGVREIRQRGKPVQARAGEPQLMAFEKTSALVTSGIYRYIRHPLYSSLLLLAWGTFFKSPSWLGGALALAASVSLCLTAKADERECLAFFGDDYKVYIGSTKRFIPWCF